MVPKKTSLIIAFRIALTLDVQIVWFGRQMAVCVQKQHKNAIFECSPFQKFNTTILNNTILTSCVKAILKAMINTFFFGTKFRGGQNFVLTVGGFFNKREYSGADWLVPLIPKDMECRMVTY